MKDLISGDEYRPALVTYRRVAGWFRLHLNLTLSPLDFYRMGGRDRFENDDDWKDDVTNDPIVREKMADSH